MSRASGTDRARRVGLGHNECVAAAAGGERLAQPGPLSVRASQAVVNIDPLRVHAERRERLPLRREILIDRRYPGVADLQLRHADSMPLRPPSSGRITEPPLRDGRWRSSGVAVARCRRAV
jgi:hypothetical protein